MKRRPHVLDHQRVEPRHLRIVRAGERLPLPPSLAPLVPPVALRRPRLRHRFGALRAVALGVLVLLATLTLAGLVAWAARSWS